MNSFRKAHECFRDLAAIAEPVKFEMAVNVKTAKALGLTVSVSLLLRADEVIE